MISNISTNLAIGPWTRNILAFAVPAGTSRSALAAYSPFSNIACLTCGTSFDGNGEYTRIRRVKFLDLRRKKDRTTGTAACRLNRDTLAFIQHGAEEGERHPRLFRAAANLREFAAPPALIHALLTEPAMDTGLAPAEVKRQIECGIAHADASLYHAKQSGRNRVVAWPFARARAPHTSQF